MTPAFTVRTSKSASGKLCGTLTYVPETAPWGVTLWQLNGPESTFMLYMKHVGNNKVCYKNQVPIYFLTDANIFFQTGKSSFFLDLQVILDATQSRPTHPEKIISKLPSSTTSTNLSSL